MGKGLCTLPRSLDFICGRLTGGFKEGWTLVFLQNLQGQGLEPSSCRELPLVAVWRMQREREVSGSLWDDCKRAATLG